MKLSENLMPLKFLLGDWIEKSTSPEGESVIREITYEWINDGNFLQGKSRKQIGDVVSGLTVTYLWDPTEKLIRSWVLSSDGTWNQAVVETDVGIVKLFTTGVTLDGQVISLTSTLRTISEKSRTEHWTNINVGGTPLADAPIIKWQKQ